MVILGEVTFSSFCKAFTTHSEKAPSHISRRLLKLITDVDSVKNRVGNRYSFKSKELLEFLNGENRIYERITKAIEKEVVKNRIRIDFEGPRINVVQEKSPSMLRTLGPGRRFCFRKILSRCPSWQVEAYFSFAKINPRQNKRRQAGRKRSGHSAHNLILPRLVHLPPKDLLIVDSKKPIGL